MMILLIVTSIIVLISFSPILLIINRMKNKYSSFQQSKLLSFFSSATILSDHDLKELIKENLLIVESDNRIHINPTSIDLCLGSTIIKYIAPQTIKPSTDKPDFYEIDISNSSYKLRPRDFVLGTTKERVSIPNGYQGFIETKGNIARAGIVAHNNDGHIDPGFRGNITLEIVNHNNDEVDFELVPGMQICQLFIGKISSSCDSPYKGKYLHQSKPTTYYP
jgi:dCTP deaminase